MTMKITSYLLPLLSLFLILSSCEEDFDITAPYKNITIAYGLLDVNDDTTFLRINKAFLGDGNVLEMVKIEDSSIYVNGLDAYIEEWSGGNFLAAYQLDSMTIDNKDTGTFYNPYQLLYFGTFEVKTDMHYKLKIFVNNKEVSSDTYPVNDFTMSQPTAGAKFINFKKGVQNAVEWESAKYGKRYEVLIRFNYRELQADDPDTIYRKVDWVLGTEKSWELRSPCQPRGERRCIPHIKMMYFTLFLPTRFLIPILLKKPWSARGSRPMLSLLFLLEATS
jgi:hypothetical protein